MRVSKEVSIDQPALMNGDAGYFLVCPREPDGRNVLLGHGFLSNPHHLLGLAKEFASEGMTVGVVEYGEPLPGETYGLPSEYKHRRACMVMEDMEHRFPSDEWRAVVHSYGGVVLKKLLVDAPEPIDDADFVCALGFGPPVKILHPERILDVIRIYGSELFSAFTRGRNILNIPALTAQATTLALKNKDYRVAEINEIKDLSIDYAVPVVTEALEAGVDVSVLVAPRDHVVKPEGTLKAMDGKAVVISKRSNHFAPITHPREVARAILYAEPNFSQPDGATVG